jgi:hypothetical protein
MRNQGLQFVYLLFSPMKHKIYWQKCTMNCMAFMYNNTKKLEKQKNDLQKERKFVILYNHKGKFLKTMGFSDEEI